MSHDLIVQPGEETFWYSGPWEGGSSRFQLTPSTLELRSSHLTMLTLLLEA